MSPLLDLQRRYRELGRIRLGVKGEKGAPRRLNEFRLTSAAFELLERVAELYGGEVREWAGAPTEGKQWEVLTGTDRLDVLIAPGEPISQNWELWTGGGCLRRCDGFTMADGSACQCPSDLEDRLELSKKGNACKPTSRLSVVLPRVPDVGVWRVESHGVNAAVELPGTVDLMRKALEAGIPIPGQLRIDQRTSKKDGQTHHFVVPVLELPTLTVEALMSGDVAEALGSGAPRALAPPAPRAIEAPKPTEATAEPAKKAAKPRKAAAKKATSTPRPQPPLPGEEPAPSADEAAPPAASTKPATQGRSSAPGDGDAPGPAAAKERPPWAKHLESRGAKAGLEPDEFVAFVRHVTGKADVAETTSDDANEVMTALARFVKGELVMGFDADGTPNFAEAGQGVLA